jgi:8-oxo-dGTP diphosphatase
MLLDPEIAPYQAAHANGERPKVGVGVFPLRDGKLLLGRRLSSHGVGEWNTPGGHLEYGEGILACAARELLEETGLSASKLRLVGVVNNLLGAEEKKHYITLCVVAEELTGTPRSCEPDKHESWGWFPLDALPHPLFASVESFLKAHPHS